MSTQYQVVFTGELKPGVDAEEAAREFASVFKVPDDKARTLILGGEARVLKKDVALANAEHYREILDEIGLIVRVEPLDAVQPEQTGEAGGTTAESDRNSTDVDPYATPAADLRRPRDTTLDDNPMTGPHGVQAGHGWQWIRSGFDLFKRAPLAWIGAVVVLMLINILVSLVPMIGGLVSSLIGPIFLGGLMLGAHAQASGGTLKVGDLFAGFTASPRRLLTVGGLYLLGVFTVVILILLVVSSFTVGISGLDPTLLEQQDPEMVLATMGPMFMLVLLFVMLFLIPLVMAYWFAPALVVLEDMQPLEAMKLSFTACWRNVLPFLVYGIAAFLLIFIGAIPFGLGLVIVLPILVASVYAGYRDVFYRR
ncbi:MAG: BPSS1780 family membrane protein [Thiohalocapsa sp.]